MPDTSDVLAMVHDDGHAAAVANSEAGARVLRFNIAVLARLGVTSWRLEHLTSEQATRKLIESRGCTGCQMVMPCGCPADLMAAGGCPHGTQERVSRIGQEVLAEMGHQQ